MEKSAKKKLVNDIENRLDDFFGEQTESVPSQEPPLSLEKLKSAVLSIDWEITDACLADLINETEALIHRFENEPVTLALLRMLRALGRYIRKQKVQAHQEAIQQVMSVYSSLETVAQNKQMTDQQKKRIVAKEVLAFKKLKEQIDSQKVGFSRPPAPAQDNRQASGEALTHDGESFAKAMQAVEDRFNSKVAQLKAELASMQKELNSLRKG